MSNPKEWRIPAGWEKEYERYDRWKAADLKREYLELTKASFDKVFGSNARKARMIVGRILRERGYYWIDNAPFGEIHIKENPGRGRGFYFLGSATSKLAARRIEAKHPGSFIHEKNGRYYILKAKRIKSNHPRKKKCNPPSKKLVRIYGRVLRIEAQKKGKHRCDAECRRCNHRYYHDFRKSNIKEYGLSPGQVFVVPPGKWPLLIID